jgi:adiponectin receptor
MCVRIMGSLAFLLLISGVFVHGIEEMLLQGGEHYALAAASYLACAGFYAVRSLLPTQDNMMVQ